MKLFKNKVGRPSNQLLQYRKMFVISVLSLILSLIAIILSFAILKENPNCRLMAEVKSKDITIDVNKYFNKGKKSFLSLTWTFKEKEITQICNNKICEKVKFIVRNSSSQDVYYRWFTYDSSGEKKWNDEKTCSSKISKNTNVYKYNPTLSFEKGNEQRTGKLKIYETKSDCENDDNGNSKKFVKEKSVVYKIEYTSESDNKEDDDENAIAILEAFINFFKHLFNELSKLFKSDDKPSNSGNNEATPPTTPPTTPPPKTTKPATFTPPVSTNLKMTVPSNGDIKHDIAVGCNTTVYAPFSGTATYTTKYYNGKTAGYGNVVEIKSSDGVYKVKLAHLNSFEGYTVLYGNAETGISCVSVSCQTKTYGSKPVKQGDIIGKTGSSGNSTGCHLHIELYKNGSKVDPSTYFRY